MGQTYKKVQRACLSALREMEAVPARVAARQPVTVSHGDFRHLVESPRFTAKSVGTVRRVELLDNLPPCTTALANVRDLWITGST